MNFLNIEYFLEAAKSLNFSKAAEKLYISPQSLSTHIAKLENELGVDLFYRDSPMRLTYAGEIMVKCGQEIIEKKNRMLYEIKDIADSKRGKLSIGISHTRGLIFLPLVLPKFHDMYPGVEIKILEAPTSKLETALYNGDIDIMIGLAPFSNNDVECAGLVNEEILMLIPNKILDTYFPGNKEEVLKRLKNNHEFSLLKECPFLMLRSENRVRAIADKILGENSVKPKVVIELDNIGTLLELSRQGMGITFYAHTLQSFSSSEKFEGLNVIKVPYEKTQSISAVYLKNRFLTAAARDFISMLQDVIQ